MTTTTRIEEYKLETIFNDDETVSHINRKFAPVSNPGQEDALIIVRTTWKRDKELGIGGFGEVWREKETGGEFRAVKMITKFTLKSSKIDYERELQVLVKVKDYPEFFVAFLGWYEDRYAIYLAMEYVQYGDLGGYMKEYGAIAEYQAIQITRQILQGLVILHENGICHRDLKPQNVLIASLTPIHIKIADFGISTPQNRTYLQTTCGTQSYQAPEQLGLLPQTFMPKQGYTKAVDIWALGVLLYKMFTSKLPFQADDTMSIFCNEDTTMITEAVQEPTIDFAMLLQYCHGSGPFPTESLLEARTSTQGIAFVKSLLVAIPKERTSAANARQNPWIVGLDGTLPGLAQALKLQFSSLGVYFSDRVLENCVERESPCLEVKKILNSHLPTMVSNCGIEVEAARRGYLEVSLILPVIGNAKTISSTLVGQAAADGNLGALSLLLSSGANVNTSIGSLFGPTPLQAAAEHGNLDAISLLLNSGANVNAEAGINGGRTALQAAAERGHLDAVILLLNSNANVNAEGGTNGGRTALQAAAERGHLDVISLLLNSGADVNAEGGINGGRTALQAAAERGHPDAIILLLNSGANVNAEAGINGGRTALQAAAERGNLDAISLLLNSGANVNAEACINGGRTALQAAAERGHLDAISLLVTSGANVNAEACINGGRTALQAAAERGHLNSMHLLLKSGANVNAEAGINGGRTALQAAAEGGHINAISLLLNSGANVSAEAGINGGRTALQAAAERGHLNAISLLLNSGADVNAEAGTLGGKTALQAAAERGHLDAISLLLNGGADVNTKLAFEDGTALGLAGQGGMISVEQLRWINSQFKKGITIKYAHTRCL